MTGPDSGNTRVDHALTVQIHANPGIGRLLETLTFPRASVMDAKKSGRRCPELLGHSIDGRPGLLLIGTLSPCGRINSSTEAAILRGAWTDRDPQRRFARIGTMSPSATPVNSTCARPVADWQKQASMRPAHVRIHVRTIDHKIQNAPTKHCGRTATTTPRLLNMPPPRLRAIEHLGVPRQRTA